MPICAECSTEYAEAACPSCGASATADATRECENCNETIAADDEGCPACGYLRTPVACEAHPEATAKAQCVICGTSVCGECDHTSGKAHLCDAHQDIPVVEGWAQVYTTATDVHAGLIRENLEAEGIDSRVLSQKDHYSFPVDLGDLSPVRVLVPAYAYKEAEAALREHMDRDTEVNFACPSCGEANEPGAESCAACGASLR